jgi:hypothetical protein
VKAESESEKITWPTYHHDFFPMINEHNWIGFYTSRAFQKKQISYLEEYTYTSQQLYSLSFMRDDSSEMNIHYKNSSSSLIKTLSIMTHHDTITGTS